MDPELSVSICVSPVTPTKARKRVANPELWKKSKAQRALYAPKNLPEFPTCGHNTKSFRCSVLTMRDLMQFHQEFHKNLNKKDQNCFLQQYIEMIPVRRRRRRAQNPSHIAKTAQKKLYIKKGEQLIPVCQKAFMNILHVTRRRIDSIGKHFFKTGNILSETRGGDRKSAKFADRKKAVMNFICSLKSVESHYCRGTRIRVYLSSDLNITKLYNMYNSQVCDTSLIVTQGYFRKVFNRNFNLGFGGSRTDMCSTCIEFSEKLKLEKDVNIKSELMSAKFIHKLRAKAFFSLLKDSDPEMLIFSFDMEKNLCLPKVPDQQAYYSRQLYLHNFTVVQGNSLSKLKTNNCFSYIWTEDQYGKGSNQIASALYHRLNNTDFSNFTKIRLVSDGCGGQNKNKIVVGMACRWFLNAPSNIQSLELIFPVRGHSFIPPDRIFGVLEREFKKREVIQNPAEYIEFMKKHATIFEASKDFDCYDWRSEAERVLRTTNSWHFKISNAKRIFIRRKVTKHSDIVVSGEYAYRSSTDLFRSICKKGQTIQNIHPGLIIPDNYNNISKEKLTDVEKLLRTHYGESWRDNQDLQYYKNILDRNSELNAELYEEEIICERLNFNEEFITMTV